jgi:mono/diheme cytochrome c family protein
MLRLRRSWNGLVALLVVTGYSVAAASPPSFERDVRPIFKAYCLDCHGATDERKGNLDLRLKRFAVQGGDSGPAIVPGDAPGSYLVMRLRSGEMPPGEKKVPPEQIAIIEAWIAAGAPTTRDEPEQLPPGIDITPEERAFWSFQPLRRPTVPSVSAATQGPIDPFVVAKLQLLELGLAPEADRRTLIRRATADLIGLAPGDDEIDAFVADASPDAYERLLDRLLASPHYGERWGRHWLDVAGYAESDGDGNADTIRPYAWHYRDYVIRALNADEPFDRFLLEQLAGDELVPLPWSNLAPEQIDTLAATGFLRTVIDATQGTSDEQAAANQVVADAIKVVGSAVYGLTIGCAQCHDHRYDPIPQTDYFRLRAILEPAFNTAQWRRPSQRLVSLYTDADRAKVAEVNAEVQKLQEALNAKTAKYVAEAFDKALEEFPEDLRPKLKDAFATAADKRTDEQKQLVAANPKLNINPGVLYQFNQKAADELKADAEAIQKKAAEKPVEDFIPVLSEIAGQIPPTYVFHRGDHRQPKQAVRPGDLTIAAPDGERFEIPDPSTGASTSGRRSAWAEHLTNGQHPLVGRVLANRIWFHHFGRGLVETVGDFGMLGTRPSHPELLDWLATELPRVEWSLKKIHRLLMSSATYRQSSTPRSDLKERVFQLDAQNTWYARFPLQRLDAESLRDRLLAVAGRFDDQLYGPSLPVEDDFVGQVVVKGDVPRRSLYVQVRRSKPLSLLTTFDAPQMMLNCERRVPSTGAPQALMLMNNDFVLQQAERAAQRIRAETPAGYASELTASLSARFPRHHESWQFGYGAYDESAKKTARFDLLPHFTGSSWQGGPSAPDPKLGWVILHAAGGHPGESPNFLPVRRWTAPQAGRLAIRGGLARGSENGDGVRGRIVSSRHGLIGEWTVKTGSIETPAGPFDVGPGETIDFIVDGLASVESDSFEWRVDLTLTASDGALIDVWKSAEEFHGPLSATASPAEQVAYAWRLIYQRLPEPVELDAACAFLRQQVQTLALQPDVPDRELTALANLCQQLLSSNEFLYVD